mmetsp:Transcript_5944/g.20327  ORF Transcript_5944/g.20327 Transcript_5944/m.20327 type:complete len:238 (+) Transcript_5944:183-896(+)
MLELPLQRHGLRLPGLHDRLHLADLVARRADVRDLPLQDQALVAEAADLLFLLLARLLIGRDALREPLLQRPELRVLRRERRRPAVDDLAQLGLQLGPLVVVDLAQSLELALEARVLRRGRRLLVAQGLELALADPEPRLEVVELLGDGPERRRVRRRAAVDVDARRVRDLPSARRVHERHERLAVVVAVRAQIRDHERLRVAAEGILEQVRELRVAVGHGLRRPRRLRLRPRRVPR